MSGKQTASLRNTSCFWWLSKFSELWSFKMQTLPCSVKIFLSILKTKGFSNHTIYGAVPFVFLISC